MRPEAAAHRSPSFPAPFDMVRSAIAAGESTGKCLVQPLTEAEWATVPELARRHGISGAVAIALSGREDTPAAVRTTLAASRNLDAIHALQSISELQRIVRALEAAGVAAVTLKGPALAQWLYGDATRRRFADLDVLVAPGDRDRAYIALQSLGYELPSGMPRDVARTIYGALGAWPLCGGGSFPLDLHWRLAHARFPAPVTVQQVIADSSSLEIGGRMVRVPSPTHAALLTLLHAAKHLWCTLELVAAIAALTRRSDVDWAQVRRLAEDAHAWNGCAAGLSLAADLLGADIPASLGGITRTEACRSLCADAAAALRRPAGEFGDRWTERHAHRAAFDRRADGLRYDVWRVIAPTPLEWQWCRLPARLRWLYVPVRLARLGAAAVRGSLRSA